MKNYLYLDSSHFVSVGVLDEKMNWRHFELTENRKGSSIIHKTIFDIFNLLDLKLAEIDGLIISSGPGSYTGIRLSEGIAQIIEMNKKKIFSFYHYEVPKFCGVKKYNFYANAFKNEYFNYFYDGNEERKNIISRSDFEQVDFSQEDVYCISGEIEEKYFGSTISLIKNNPNKIFSSVVGRNKHLEPYYYRPLEKEFKPSVKQ